VSEGARARNLLLITTDQERRFARDPVPLPAHERLRQAGTSYDRFYAASMACSSARSVMYTGQHAPVTGVIDNVGLPGQPSMTTAIPTLGSLLGDRGYLTAYKGKWHLSTEALEGRATGPLPDSLLAYGFADYNAVGDDLGLPYDGYRRDPDIAADAAEWLATSAVASSSAGRPWCLAVNFVNPHDIMFGTSDEALLSRSRSAPPERGAYVGPPENDLYAAQWNLPDDLTWSDPLHSVGRPAAHDDFYVSNRVFLGDAATNVEELRHFRDYYFNCLRDVDVSIGRVLDALAATGLDDETVIIYTSDHGELAGAHGLFGKGPCAYDENLRLPFVVVDPDRPGGRSTSVIGSQVDLVPTALALATGKPPGSDSGLVGRSLAPARGDVPELVDARQSALFAYDGLIFLDGDWATRTRAGMRADDPVTGRDFTKRGLMRTLISDRYKFSRYFAPGEHHVPGSMEELLERNTLELFDTRADPGEVTNLAHEPGGDLLGLIESLDRELSDLITDEIGEDDGHWLPAFEGTPWMTAESDP
jgi:arylsulfatase A-like enzyme